MEIPKYVGKFSEPQIELIMSTVLCYFHEYAVQYFRSGITECILSEEYQQVAKEEEICIYTGELYEKIDIVWKENKRSKSLYEVKRLIEEKEQMDFYDFKGMELNKLDFSLMNLPYADFSQMEVREATYTNSSLRGAKFQNSTLAEVNFMGSSIQEADFRQAELSDVNFMFAEFTRGIENPMVWKKAGYLPVKFDGAILTRVNFTSARLQHIDFSKSVLKEVNFEGAELEKCIFHASQLEDLELSDKQKQGSIIII